MFVLMNNAIINIPEERALQNIISTVQVVWIIQNCHLHSRRFNRRNFINVASGLVCISTKIQCQCARKMVFNPRLTAAQSRAGIPNSINRHKCIYHTCLCHVIILSNKCQINSHCQRKNCFVDVNVLIFYIKINKYNSQDSYEYFTLRKIS